MPTAITGFLRVDLDLTSGTTEQYTITNDLTYTNKLYLFFFTNTTVRNQNITLTVNQYDGSNSLQDSDTYTINYNTNLKREILLTTINTTIVITYSSFSNGTLNGIFEKKINNNSSLNTISNQILNLNLASGVNLSGVFGINHNTVDISGQSVIISNPSLIVDSKLQDASGNYYSSTGGGTTRSLDVQVQNSQIQITKNTPTVATIYTGSMIGNILYGNYDTSGIYNSCDLLIKADGTISSGATLYLSVSDDGITFYKLSNIYSYISTQTSAIVTYGFSVSSINSRYIGVIFDSWYSGNAIITIKGSFKK